MVNLAGTPWVADSLRVPGQAHRQTVDLRVEELAALDLLTDAAASDGLAVDCMCLVLAKETSWKSLFFCWPPNAAATCTKLPKEGRQVAAGGWSDG